MFENSVELLLYNIFSVFSAPIGSLINKVKDPLKTGRNIRSCRVNNTDPEKNKPAIKKSHFFLRRIPFHKSFKSITSSSNEELLSFDEFS